MVEIVVEVPTDRRNLGRLTLKDDAGNVLAGPFDAYGKSDNLTAINHGNSARDPLLPYGDTPLGSYEIPRAVATGTGTNYPDHSYGSSGALVLRPVGGQALSAAANGRTGLLIHSGDPGVGGRLRPTNGCVRLSGADMSALMAALEAASTSGAAPICSALEISATVREGDVDDGSDDGDPPPNIQQLLDGTTPDPIIWRP
jgi:hypothetical protein